MLTDAAAEGDIEENVRTFCLIQVGNGEEFEVAEAFLQA